MDAAERAELALLRRRAYGPDPDLDDAALQRLAWLEDRARPQAESAAQQIVDAPAGAASPRPARRRRGALIALAAVAGAGIAATLWWPRAGAAPEQTPTPDPTIELDDAEPRFDPEYATETIIQDSGASVLWRITLDGSFAGYIDLPAPPPVPVFPAAGEPQWAQFLGEYYGWRLWLAGASGTPAREHCIVLEKISGPNPRDEARCSLDSEGLWNDLLVSAAYEELPPGDRPPGMVPGQRVAFWWSYSQAVTVFVADAPSA